MAKCSKSSWHQLASPLGALAGAGWRDGRQPLPKGSGTRQPPVPGGSKSPRTFSGSEFDSFEPRGDRFKRTRAVVSTFFSCPQNSLRMRQSCGIRTDSARINLLKSGKLEPTSFPTVFKAKSAPSAPYFDGGTDYGVNVDGPSTDSDFALSGDGNRKFPAPKLAKLFSPRHSVRGEMNLRVRRSSSPNLFRTSKSFRGANEKSIFIDKFPFAPYSRQVWRPKRTMGFCSPWFNKFSRPVSFSLVEAFVRKVSFLSNVYFYQSFSREEIPKSSSLKIPWPWKNFQTCGEKFLIIF